MTRLRLLGMALLLCGVATVHAESSEDRVAALEERVRELESATWAGGGGASWTDRVRLSGNLNAGFYGGPGGRLTHAYGDEGYKNNFRVWDARIFTEADLARDVTLGSRTMARGVGALLELEFARINRQNITLREAYVDIQGILDSDWLNMQVGRFQIPLGENYLRFSQGYAGNPFISNTLGGPWYWDEGVRLFGSSKSGKVGYVASVTDAESSTTNDLARAKQMTLKLKWDPAAWAHFSVSGARSGRLGPGTGGTALWFGEAWARPYGAGTTLTNLDHGAALADGPADLQDVTFWGGDAVLEAKDKVRAWLAGGRVDIRQGMNLPVYDRALKYWVAEAVVEGAAVSEKMRPFYLGLRANGFGTYDDDRGYLLDFRFANRLGYNMKSMTAYSVAPGWRLSPYATLKAEYTWQEIDLVRGASAVLLNNARHADIFGIETAVHF